MNFRIDTTQAMDALQSIKPTMSLMQDIAYNSAQPIIKYQKSHAPKDTGRTADSVTYDIVDLSFASVSIDVGPTTPYAVYLEYGTGEFAEGGGGRSTTWKYKNRFGEWVSTKGMHAQPFVRPSAEDPSVGSEMQRELFQTVNDFVQANWHKRSWKSKLSGIFKRK